LIDFKRLVPDVKGLDRDYATVLARVEHEGTGFLTRTLPLFGAEIDLSLSLERWTQCSFFARKKGMSLPSFLIGLTSRVFDEKSGLLLDNPSVEAVKCLREFCYLFKKLGLTDDQDEHLDRRAKLGFFKCDSDICLSDRYLSALEAVSREVLIDLDEFDNLPYKHGPGAVSEKLSPNQKWSGVVSGLFDFDPLLVHSGFGVEIFNAKQNEPSRPDIVLGDIARLISVAKNSSSRRTITIEPLLKQYIQQGLHRHLKRTIRHDFVLSNCLSLSDQSRNQRLALIGSLTGEYATIDLSSASDRLSLEVVTAVFGHHHRFLSMMLLSRAERVDLSTVSLRKFAGMGNALTFPVQSVVFSLVAMSAILSAEGQTPTLRNLRRVSHSIQVYGDDIIVPTRYYSQVVEWLESFGLVINQKKSFHRGNFRESCGVDAFKGYNVTPKYLRHEPSFTSNSAKALEALVELSNHMWDDCLYTTSEYLRAAVEKSIQFSLPLVGRKSSCLGWHTRRDAYNFSRWNYTLHRFEVRSLVGSPVYRKDPLDGHAALMKSLSVPLLGRDIGHLKRSPRRHSLCHKVRWVRAS